MTTKYVQTNTFYLAGSGVIIGATTVTLTTLTDIYGNILTMDSFGDKGFITLEPDTNNEESATFTGITANDNGTYTLTGIKTGLAQDPYTETTGLIRAHAGGTKVVVTDSVQFWNTFTNKHNDETVDGQWTFTNTPIVPGTVSDASTTVKGVTKVSVAPDSASNPISVGTNDPRVPVAYATDSVGTDSYAISPSPSVAAYVEGQKFTFKAGTANTGTASLNVSGLGARTIKKNLSLNLNNNDILAGQIVEVVYDGTNMQMTSPNNIAKFSGSSGTNTSSATFPITFAHGCSTTPVQTRVTLISNQNAAWSTYDSGVYVSRLGDYSSPSAGLLLGADVSNYYAISVTVDATNVTLAITATVGSPGTKTFNYFINSFEQ